MKLSPELSFIHRPSVLYVEVGELMGAFAYCYLDNVFLFFLAAYIWCPLVCCAFVACVMEGCQFTVSHTHTTPWRVGRWCGEEG